MDACIRHSKLDGYDAKPTLFFEFHGSARGGRRAGGAGAADRRRARRRRVPLGHRARGAHAAVEGAAQRVLRGARACSPARPVCSPTLRADLAAGRLHRSRRARTSTPPVLPAPIVGHVGDGNFHVLRAGRSERCRPSARAPRRSTTRGRCARSRWAAPAPASTASASGKLDALVAEHGAAVDVMRTIKRALDPLDIMNPGKTVPDGRRAAIGGGR